MCYLAAWGSNYVQARLIARLIGQWKGEQRRKTKRVYDEYCCGPKVVASRSSASTEREGAGPCKSGQADQLRRSANICLFDPSAQSNRHGGTKRKIILKDVSTRALRKRKEVERKRAGDARP
jgi:hypothetical protein